MSIKKLVWIGFVFVLGGCASEPERHDIPSEKLLPHSQSIDNQIQEQRSKIKVCYDDIIEHVTGRVTIEFRIEKTGNVSNAKISKSTTGSEALDNCVLSVLKKIKFEKPEKGGVIEVSYPFKFGAGR